MQTESVWDYPRPPRVEPVPQKIRIELGGRVVAESDRALRVLETSHPPAYYVPAADFAPGALVASSRLTYCEFKGAATYWSLRVGDTTVADAAKSTATGSAESQTAANQVGAMSDQLQKLVGQFTFH